MSEEVHKYGLVSCILMLSEIYKTYVLPRSAALKVFWTIEDGDVLKLGRTISDLFSVNITLNIGLYVNSMMIIIKKEDFSNGQALNSFINGPKSYIWQ